MHSSEYINQHSAYVLISIVQVIKHKGWFKNDVTGGGGYPKMVTNGEVGGGGYVQMVTSQQYFFNIYIFYYFHHKLSEFYFIKWSHYNVHWCWTISTTKVLLLYHLKATQHHAYEEIDMISIEDDMHEDEEET